MEKKRKKGRGDTDRTGIVFNLWLPPVRNTDRIPFLALLLCCFLPSVSGLSPSNCPTTETPSMATMKHIVNTPGCTASELTLGECARPVVGPGEVLIETHFAGVGATDIALRKGTSHVKPKEGTPHHHLILGLELSGIIVEVGEGVTNFSVGERVCALVYGGGYAEWAVAPQEQVLALPEGMSLEIGAAIPENFWTVWANVFHPNAGDSAAAIPLGFITASLILVGGNLLDGPEGKTLLVHGGAGGIGSTAIALAHRFGAKVTCCPTTSVRWTNLDLTLGNYNSQLRGQGRGCEALWCRRGYQLQ
jgi:D-arabinose 1-dehydrogenase-like Zn-dependent alcohol dehydrogenase